MDTAPTVDILIVDDNPNQLTALRVILAELGANIVCVGSGRDALRALLHRDFAAILLDVNMPTMDGFETAHLIRQRARSEHTPIIFITAFADETHVARGYSLGAVDYILTPVVPEVLRAKVSVFIELFRKSAEVRRQAESLRRRAEQLHGLTAASLAIHEARTIDSMLAIVAERARAITRVRFGAARVRFDATRVHDADARVVDSTVPPTRAILDDALARVSASTSPVYRASVAGSGDDDALHGSLAVPLTTRDGRILGVLIVAGKDDGELTGDDAALLVQLGQMAAIAAENTVYSEEREANRLKDEFLATVSHELRTPLTAMLSWVRLLQGGSLDGPERIHALEVIDRNARAQARLVDDLLDTSRIVTGKLQIQREPVALEGIVAEAVESVRPSAAAKGIELHVVLESDAVVSGDAKRLQQVVGNLLSNAIKFTPQDGRVEIGMRRDGDEVELRVRDSGPGISAEFLPHVFDRFRQADTSTTRMHGGLGLGLAIVRHLVDLHGGSVRAESAQGQPGAAFVVRLPLAPAAAAAPSASRDGDGAEQVALDGVRILVVEDDADGREAIAMVLTSAGAEVVAVASVRAALTAITDGPPDVIVSDIGLPVDDGYVLIDKVRELENGTARVPAIALTAYTRPQDRARALAAGFQAHVSKPVDADELLAAVASYAPSRVRQHAV